jgi:hypothetical protein
MTPHHQVQRLPQAADPLESFLRLPQAADPLSLFSKVGRLQVGRYGFAVLVCAPNELAAWCLVRSGHELPLVQIGRAF